MIFFSKGNRIFKEIDPQYILSLRTMRSYFVTTICLLSALLFIPQSGNAFTFTNNDSTGLDGDHFSLEGALELFKQSDSPEAFEKALNTENNYVNNLDLDQDGEIDYIRVEDMVEGDMHAITLSVNLSEDETQDIAVIGIEKQGPEEAILQIIGDANLYGEEKIVEPFDLEVEGNDGKGGPAIGAYRAVVVNVWLWPFVVHVYRPAYRPYRSPWRYRYYPTWFRPWRPHPWRFVSTYRVRYTRAYRPVATYRVTRVHKVYTPRRRTSTVVASRTTRVRVNNTPGRKVGTTRTTTTRTTTTTANRRRPGVKPGAKPRRTGQNTKTTTTTSRKRTTGTKARTTTTRTRQTKTTNRKPARRRKP